MCCYGTKSTFLPVVDPWLLGPLLLATKETVQAPLFGITAAAPENTIKSIKVWHI
jgi:hypothetical protein